MTGDDLGALDGAHHLHPFASATARPRLFTRAEGVHVWDEHGAKLLDTAAGMLCVNIGYGRRELAEAAHRQMLDLSFCSTFGASTHPGVIALATRLARLCPDGLSHAFFTNSGSEACDSAVMMARLAAAQRGQREKTIIIRRANAYHGATLGAASLSGPARADAAGIACIRAPARHGGSGLDDAAALEEKILELGPHRVAAFIAEPVQATAGVIVPPPDYWPSIARICRRHDVLLILDEVSTGFGRLGAWFGCELFGVRPDLMLLGKGLTSGYVPLAAVMVGDGVAAALSGGFRHGFTASGHPVAAAVALANLDVMEAEGLATRTAGPRLQARTGALADHPLVGAVRGMGMLAALDLVADKQSGRRFAHWRMAGETFEAHAYANGLLTRVVDDTILLAPPLIVTDDDIDFLATALRRALDATAADLAGDEQR